MALPSTMHQFQLDITDVDRGVYEAVELRAARHPSESVPFLVTRILAFALEYREGLAFGRGVSTPDEPALWVVGPGSGATPLWIEVGAPSPERLHKVTKRAADVAVYTFRDVHAFAANLAGAKVHRSEDLRLVGLPPEIVEGLGEELERRNAWAIVRTEGSLYVTTSSGAGFEGQLQHGRASSD